MNLVKILDNSISDISQRQFYLLGDNPNELVFNGFEIADGNHTNNDGIYISLFNQENFNSDNQAILLTADNTPDDIDFFKNHLSIIKEIYFYVFDFKDGRVFSLIKYLRNQGFNNDIYISGEFGLDQANYFVKSGATGFIVSDDKLDTLKRTLNDLQTGHFGQSANMLPMFR